MIPNVLSGGESNAAARQQENTSAKQQRDQTATAYGISHLKTRCYFRCWRSHATARASSLSGRFSRALAHPPTLFNQYCFVANYIDIENARARRSCDPRCPPAIQRCQLILCENKKREEGINGKVCKKKKKKITLSDAQPTWCSPNLASSINETNYYSARTSSVGERRGTARSKNAEM